MTENPANAPLCSYLDWDSSFFERRIARLNASRLEPAITQQALQWCAQNRIDCLYFLADSDDPQTKRLAEQNRFQFVDVRVTYERAVASIGKDKTEANVRLAREEDLPFLAEIARTGHHDSRFYFDEHFDRLKCDQLYETWIRNSFHGFADAVLVAESGQQAAAYVTCKLTGSEAQIGLIGVHQAYRGQGLGSTLVTSFLSWARERGAVHAKVVTQGRNAGAQRLYQKSGFLLASSQLWYHGWLSL